MSLDMQDLIDALARSNYFGRGEIATKIADLKLCSKSPNFYHKWVGVGFTSRTQACKYCDINKIEWDKDLEELELLKEGYGFFG